MTPSEQIDKSISELKDWRGKLYTELRALINEAAPEMKEDWKWSTAVWTKGGNVIALGAFKNHIKINFFKGASMSDPDHLFNNGFTSKLTRAIDFFENDKVNKSALISLVRAAAKK